MEVASQIVVMNHGVIEQKGTPSEIYDQPGNDFVSRFIGQTNIFHIDRDDPGWLADLGLEVDPAKGAIAHVRPHHIDVERLEPGTDSPVLVKDWQHLGSNIRLELSRPGAARQDSVLFVEMPGERFRALGLTKGDLVKVNIKQAHWFH